MNDRAPRFTPRTEQALRRAGWWQGRRSEYEAARQEKALQQLGIPPMPAAHEILLEFGGLSLDPLPRGKECFYGSVTLDAVAAGYDSQDELEACGKTLGFVLYPLGMIDKVQSVLACDEWGRVYDVVNGVTRIGESFDEALETMVYGLNGTHLYEPTRLHP
jgi:hypothetical protein